ncbi:microcephalin isoform X2 [Pimephales promelas]|nr:microcephalin isoform X2 [Pimephales promelas]KAG1930307.1 microcephalin [Pimephales promelas]
MTSTALLKDVVAYVDVWSASRMEDYSDPFIQQLLSMGAEVSKTLNKQVTHVVFKHGRLSTWKKAQTMGVRIVSVHWVARCKESNEHVDEDLFPAQNEVSNSKLHHLNKRTHRCMQPRDFPIKTPENDRRLKKRIDKMMEDMISSSPVVSDTSPFVIDEESGIVYSPFLKRSDSMAQRLREMRAQREHLSPTASQMQESSSGYDSSLRTFLGASPAPSFLQQLEEEPLDCLSTSHCHSSKKRDEQEKQNYNKSITKITSKIDHTPPESDTAMTMSNPSNGESNVNVPSLSSRSQQSLVNYTGGKKQSTLNSFFHKTCFERKQSSHLKPETENIGIFTALSSSPEKRESSQPESLTKTNYKKFKSVQHSKELQTNSKRSYSRDSSSGCSRFISNENVIQNDGSVTFKPVHKCQRQTSAALCSADSIGDLPRDVEDDEVFEDIFSPANNALKQRVILFGSTSEAVHMSTFDLEDSNKKSKRSSSKKRKHENINIKDLVHLSDPVDMMEEIAPEMHESRPECLSVETFEVPQSSRLEAKFKPLVKKPRKQTRLSSAVLSEVKERKSSFKVSLANEKASTASSPMSPSVVNMKLQIQKFLKPDPDPKRGNEKRQMGLKIAGENKGKKSTAYGIIEL